MFKPGRFARHKEHHRRKRIHLLWMLPILWLAGALPELVLHIEELARCIQADMPFIEICQRIEEYKKRCGLVFMLGSLKNFAANGRVSPAIAKIAGVLNIRIVGKASDAPTDWCKTFSCYKLLQTTVLTCPCDHSL